MLSSKNRRFQSIFLGVLLVGATLSCKMVQTQAPNVSYLAASEGGSHEPLALIPEIQSLPPGGLVPASVYTENDTRTIGENIAFRWHRLFEKGKAKASTAVTFDLMRTGMLTQRVPAAVVVAVLASGFLNQHQTGSSKGSFSPDWRARTENTLSTLALEPGYSKDRTSRIQLIRPKYSWMDFDTDHALGSKGDATQYGEVVFVFKDDVKKRTTFTVSDSLGLTSSTREFQATFYGDSVNAVNGSYFEAQIWGELDISDVAYMAIPPSHEKTSIVVAAQSAGLPIRSFTVGVRSGRRHFLPGAELYSGDRAKLEELERRRVASRLVAGRPVSLAAAVPVVAVPPPAPPPVTVPAPAPSAPIVLSAEEKFAGRIFSEGESFKTPAGETYQVVQLLNEGDHTRVYKIKNSRGDLYVIKSPIDRSPANLKEITDELARITRMKEMGLAHAFAIESGAEYLIKPFLGGERADEWIKKWERAGFPDATAQIKALEKIIEISSSAAVYIGDLNPKNLIWNGEDWVIIDSGDFIRTSDKTSALKRYIEKMEDRWGRRLSSENLTKGCALLFGKLRARHGL